MTTFYAENTPSFICDKCDFKSHKKSDFERHILTAKHKRLTSMSTNYAETVCDHKSRHNCACGKVYNSRQSLYRHRKTCNRTATPLKCATIIDDSQEIPNSNSLSNDTISALLQDNVEMRKTIMQQQEQLLQQQERHHNEMKELIPQIQQVTNINNNCNNTTNNRFNLNFFLNEQCKDAISRQNFIENLNIGIPELEHMGNVGYVQGMMSIFSNTLGAMDIYKRPLHCTDLKRETLYIKQGNTWKKDTEDKTELKKLIKTVEYKNYGSLRLWEREHPEAFECDTQDNIDYMRISNESLGGFDSTDAIKLGKIMKHVVREVYIKQ